MAPWCEQRDVWKLFGSLARDLLVQRQVGREPLAALVLILTLPQGSPLSDCHPAVLPLQR